VIPQNLRTLLKYVIFVMLYFWAATQEEAATAYDMAAIEYRGLNAVTNFDLSRYIKSLSPNNQNIPDNTQPKPNDDLSSIQETDSKLGLGSKPHHPSSSASESMVALPRSGNGSSASSALGLLLQSPKFKEMLERTSMSTDCSST
jgi:AP2-like factor (ANT lineage)